MRVEPLSHLDLRKETTPTAIGARIVDTCRKARLVIVRTDAERGRHREFWDEALAGHAERAAVDEDARTGQANGSVWSDVTFDPARQNIFRHSRSAQPLHTDGAYVADPPPIVFMVCRQSAPSGGATLFLDGPHLDDTLSREQPDLRERLMSERILFGKGKSEVESPILRRAESLQLRWNYYAVSPRSSPAAWSVVEAFRRFLTAAVERCAPVSIRLQPGEAVFFHDSALLHGRNSFVAQRPGARCLWKGGLRL